MKASISEKVYNAPINAAVLALVPATAQYILDIGCGAGTHARALSERGLIIDGITLSEKEKSSATEWCRKVHLHNCESGLPDLTKKYDCVICSHVLEHIASPGLLLKNIHQILSPHGVLVVALPNLLNYKSRWHLLRGRFDYTEGGTMDYTHIRWYTFKTAKELLEQYNFSIVYASAPGAFPLPWVRRVFGLKGKTIWLDRLASHRWPGLFGGQLVFAAQPRN
jgi:2-polyprenyl-3-methyl-5-hydroxy-6-metoxy-1,4-benzoquinol methylase